MTFPTTTISTDNLDSSADDPSQARTDLYNAVTALNTIISEADTAYGVAVLDGSGYVKSAQIPVTISASGTQILSPSTGVVNIQNILRLSVLPKATITALSTPQQGDIAFCSNVTGTSQAGIAFYDGSAWKGLPFNANVFVSL
jgi:hypothetical protein